MSKKFSFFAAFLLLCNILFAQDYKIISSSATSITVEYKPVFTDTSVHKESGTAFLGAGLLYGNYSKSVKAGAPLLPFRLLNIGVPQEFGNTITVLETQSFSLTGKPSPYPTVYNENGTKLTKYEVNELLYSQYTNEDYAVFDEFGYIREIPVQTIKISPVRYFPQSNEIKYYTKIVFQVNFASASASSSVINDAFLKNVILNYSVAKNWGATSVKLSKKASESSVLASGAWVRFNVTEEGIYKIDYSTLSTLGFTPSSVDPRTIKIYNNGGYQLPVGVNTTRPVDLVENAIYVSGESDGTFDSGDYILFYGRGVDFWEPSTYKVYDSSTRDSVTVTKVKRVKHQFTTKNYYWITAGGTTGKRMESKTPVTADASVTQTTSKAYVFKEDETTKIEETGRLYFGDLFSSSAKSRTYTNTLNEFVSGTTVNYTLNIAHVDLGGDTSSLPMYLYESGTLILTSSSGISAGVYGFGCLVNKTASYTGTLESNRSTFKIAFDNFPSSTRKMYLDYFEIEYQRYLNAVSNSLTFFSLDTAGVVNYKLSNFSSSAIEVYDVTDYSNVEKVYLQADVNISGGDCSFNFNSTKNDVHKYVAVTSAAYKSVSTSSKETISNSNYRGESAGVEYVVIAPPALETDANTLSSYRSGSAPVKHTSAVFLTDKIYNEFSCGVVDPTAIRDFLKYAYNNWTTKPLYVLFLGDGTYDYLEINTNSASKNLIPTMQTEESLDEVESYPVEDYFARISGTDTKVDIAIGRICVHSSDEAQAVIAKIKEYEALDETDKNWRNLITLVADDAFPLKNLDYSLHTNQAEQLAESYIPKTFNLNKIYLAAYPTNITSSGRRKPDVNQALLDAMSNGTMLLSYIGHGAPNVWADELILETSSTTYLQNTKYYFLTAATCDFGKFDASSEESGAEKMCIASGTGSIGALAAARPTYPGPNFQLSSYFFYVLLTQKEDGIPISIGKAYFLTKQNQSNTLSNDERYLLFGDPALILKIPQLPVNVDSINGVVSSVSSQIKALDNVTIKGTILNADNTKSTLSGEALISVFDSEKDVAIAGQDDDPSTYNVTYQGGLIYRGKVTVTNGEYGAAFVVPKDISYENKNGKIVTYFYNSSSDGVGYSDNIIVGGTNTSVTDDGTGPVIEVYFDNYSSQGSYLVNSSFTLLVKLSDQTGLNTTGVGIGHKLEAVINDDDSNPIDLTNYFIGDLDSGGKSGVISYSFSNYEPGEYKIKLKAWDVFNNSSISETYFTVVESNSLVVKNVVNYPNPFSSNTTFTFQHNLSKEINAKIKIYTVSGRLIKQLENTNIIDKFVRIDWDGRDEDGNSIANGTYLYKLIVETVDKEYTQDVLGKLSIVR